ncbi:MAG: Rpn family recombination-promoting nuclease/putative transposase [Tannerella sp.]|nr:Rpn family recombination-promoting nuclease/putative transposase [Tannerella sp.]
MGRKEACHDDFCNVICPPFTRDICIPLKTGLLLQDKTNCENAGDKYHCVDILAENDAKEIFIIEIRNSRKVDYFYRILYGVSKAVSKAGRKAKKNGRNCTKRLHKRTA